MKGVLLGGLLVLLLSSYVFAGSEMEVGFSVNAPEEIATGYASVETGSDGSFVYVVLVVAVLVGLYFFLKGKKRAPKKKSEAKGRKVNARVVSRSKKRVAKRVVKKVVRRKAKK